MDDKRSTRIEDKLDRVAEDIGEIKVTLASQHISLSDHIRRTELLEEVVEPIKRHMAFVSALGRIGGGVIALITLAAAIYEILGFYVKKS